jgi:ribosomal protein L34E
MKNYKVIVKTNDGCTTIWYEKSRAKTATKMICNRVSEQLQGLNLRSVTVEVSV